MDYFQIEVSKINKPSGLLTVESLWGMEVSQVLVVHENLDRERGSMKVVSPQLQSANDSEEFTVIDVVIPFCWEE